MAFVVFPEGGVKKHDRCHVLPEGFGNAGDLLCQNPHTYPIVAGAKPKINQLTCAAFYVFGGGTVIEDK